MISIRQSEDVCVQPFNLAKAVTEKGLPAHQTNLIFHLM